MQVTDAMVAAALRIRDTAMKQTLVARIPESGQFGAIAQDADWLVDTLTAALAEMWRPIEEAPKDGAEFLGFGGGVEGDNGIQVVRWCERVGCWETETASLEDWDNQAEGYSRPTHFMPLPAPPMGRG